MRQRALELMEVGAAAAGCTTDIEAYYSSIDRNKLFAALLEQGCRESDVLVLMIAYTAWAERAGLHGIPIGPEASAVVGNFFLAPLDKALMDAGLIHFRYMDDFIILGRHADDALEVIDRELPTLGLQRSEPKTHLFHGPAEAAAILTDATLNYHDAFSPSRSTTGVELRSLFDDVLKGETPSRSHFRYAVKGLRQRKDPYAVEAMVSNPNLLRVDPRLGADYISGFIRGSQTLRESLMSLVSSPSTTPEDEAVHLHLLRIGAKMVWGRAEGLVFEDLALDDSGAVPVRGWAWRCLARSSRWRPMVTMEAAAEMRNPHLRRAVVTTLRRAPDSVALRRFLQPLEEDRDLRYTAMWVQAA